MTFFAYIYQVKIIFKNYFNTNKAFMPTDEETRCAEEVSANFNYNLKLKCKKAAQEIQYINSFTYWPITEAKSKTEKNEIIYMDIRRTKQTTITQKNYDDNEISEAINKMALTNKVIVIKRPR
ncbi:hypothetical protein [Colwellia sp. 12G3]|uniref:hypothetical protein n=1 Tax=Colwellia sp. 12G3 TaxID=2058299 RepID=UPI000C332FB7|nr:hypothetical protein [Colwellia sp. 12G3]PKI16063.1 hypothetical protein CXF71_10445 [Colwellia sp. 12G3]